MKQPLADRMRPEKIEDVVGQKHILSKGKVLYNIIESGTIPNKIFYGPSGTGKISTPVTSEAREYARAAWKDCFGSSGSPVRRGALFSQLI